MSLLYCCASPLNVLGCRGEPHGAEDANDRLDSECNCQAVPTMLAAVRNSLQSM